jgi:hypothetical protein
MDRAPGLLAEFTTAEALLGALRALRDAGFGAVSSHGPYDLDDELDEVLQLRPPWLPRAVFIAGIAGMVLAFAIQWWADVHSYPMDVGGRPHFPIPAFIPITFESTVLAAALLTFGGWMIALRLPKLWAPLDEVDGIERASIDRFWLEMAEPEGAIATEMDAMLQRHGAVRVVHGTQT